jgi:hypothetical protein
MGSHPFAKKTVLRAPNRQPEIHWGVPFLALWPHPTASILTPIIPGTQVLSYFYLSSSEDSPKERMFRNVLPLEIGTHLVLYDFKSVP